VKIFCRVEFADTYSLLNPTPIYSPHSCFHQENHQRFIDVQTAAFESGVGADCEIKVGNRVFKVSLMPSYQLPYFQVSKSIIGIHSAVLCAAFQHDTIEKKTGCLTISDLDEKLIGAMLRYFYTGTVENLIELHVDLYFVADRYAVHHLKVGS
jgi:hypothetical protein